MSQQYPQQPGWGAPQQPGYGPPNQPQHPGWGAPPPPPPKKSPLGKILGFGCLGIVALFVILAAIGAAIGGTDTKDTGASSSASADNRNTDEEPAAAPEKKPSSSAPAPQGPVKITAKKTAFNKSVLADNGSYTSVLVTIVNNGDEQISINPLYFTITGTDGTKRTAELAVDENQLDTVDLAPGENISGAITGKGAFTPKYVTYTDGLFGDPVRSNVS